MQWALIFSLKKLFFNLQYLIFALRFDVFAQEIICYFTIPHICTELWWFRSRNPFVIFNTQFMHCVLMLFIMKLFCNFQCRLYALSFDVFAQEIHLLFLIPSLCTEFWCCSSWNYFSIFNSQFMHWALMFSLKNSICNF